MKSASTACHGPCVWSSSCRRTASSTGTSAGGSTHHAMRSDGNSTWLNVPTTMVRAVGSSRAIGGTGAPTSANSPWSSSSTIQLPHASAARSSARRRGSDISTPIG